jgi:hypothetical protein
MKEFCPSHEGRTKGIDSIEFIVLRHPYHSEKDDEVQNEDVVNALAIIVDAIS